MQALSQRDQHTEMCIMFKTLRELIFSTKIMLSNKNLLTIKKTPHFIPIHSPEKLQMRKLKENASCPFILKCSFSEAVLIALLYCIKYLVTDWMD